MIYCHMKKTRMVIPFLAQPVSQCIDSVTRRCLPRTTPRKAKEINLMNKEIWYLDNTVSILWASGVLVHVPLSSAWRAYHVQKAGLLGYQHALPSFPRSDRLLTLPEMQGVSSRFTLRLLYVAFFLPVFPFFRSKKSPENWQPGMPSSKIQ